MSLLAYCDFTEVFSAFLFVVLQRQSFFFIVFCQVFEVSLVNVE